MTNSVVTLNQSKGDIAPSSGEPVGRLRTGSVEPHANSGSKDPHYIIPHSTNPFTIHHIRIQLRSVGYMPIADGNRCI
jgi:hypothetical protein